jgi:prevent-host-death family protein
MGKIISAMKARQNLGQLLEEAFYRGEKFVIKRGNKPMAVLIPINEYEQFKRQRNEDFSIYDEIWELNRDIPMEEIERDVQEAVEEVRAKRRAK